MQRRSQDAVRAHYEAAADSYARHYDPEALHDLSAPYPANYFRMGLLIDSFAEKGIRRVLEVGVGEGTPLASLAERGLDVWGFDLAQAMVERCRENFRRRGLDPERIAWGDVEQPSTWSGFLRDGPFDGLIAMGVMPHVRDDDAVLDHMKAAVRPGGSVFVEFRNKLFSLFTFNRYTAEFVLDDLLAGVSPALKDLVAADLRGRLRLDQPPVREHAGAAPGYDAIPSRFHNPFEVVETFARHGFSDVRLLWYHYHPAMPYLEPSARREFREEGLRLEGETSSWRGYFLCSAFVVEAVRADG